jgi:hypothetical protein
MDSMLWHWFCANEPVGSCRLAYRLAIILSLIWRVSSLVYLQQIGCAAAKAKAARCGGRELAVIPSVPLVPLDRSPEDDDFDQVVNNTSPADDPSGRAQSYL